MGTNYYTKEKTCPTCGHTPEGIHLGKSSGGWQFTFQYNGGRLYKNVDEMTVWLRDKEIKDEYGETISQEDFWKMVQEKQGLQRGTEHCLNIDGYDFLDCQFS